MEHMIPVPKVSKGRKEVKSSTDTFQADSVIMIEIQPLNNSQHSLYIFASFEKIPTFRSFEYYTKVSDLPKNETLEDFKYNFWFLNNSQVQNRTGGRWFISIMELTEDLTQTESNDKTFDKSKISAMSTDYLLRTYTAGCYFLDEKYEEWTGN